MSFFGLFAKRSSAPIARDRLQILLQHERAFVGGSDLAAGQQPAQAAYVTVHRV